MVLCFGVYSVLTDSVNSPIGTVLQRCAASRFSATRETQQKKPIRSQSSKRDYTTEYDCGYKKFDGRLDRIGQTQLIAVLQRRKCVQWEIVEFSINDRQLRYSLLIRKALLHL